MRIWKKIYPWFQERGAPHIHGVLWLNLTELENLSRIDGHLTKAKNGNDKPLKGISKTFAKLRTSGRLDAEDLQKLVSFIDGFITVSTHGNKIQMNLKYIYLHIYFQEILSEMMLQGLLNLLMNITAQRLASKKEASADSNIQSHLHQTPSLLIP